ncbi:cyclase [Mycobacterium sp. 852002-53434_SCH5985345]|uniref:SRPBCC family protein n=1 Tax=unclassified Mycobacterium TaxID=2642494 RepID=UPI0008018520|nr:MULTISPECIES: SRPBCC family protein [unclassified Mycobacterium]OBF58841.1 cyclase [Mycobacterium sp. 852002-53434_SCH5985345]OBF72849.1 cyclase [Mycobacterium sp. 852002-51613_SCH5001154]OBF94322.1 cyclase [Mycobacterium sp. 852014-52450_SCH5900713]
MADIHRTRTIAARIGDVWETLADFAAISSWAGNVDHSCILFSGPDGAPVGTARRVQVNRDALVERITEFDPPRALGYDIEGLPRRLRRVSNRWTLAPATADSAAATAVTLTSTVEIGPHAMQKLAELALCRVLARQSESMLAGLANRLEHAGV